MKKIQAFSRIRGDAIPRRKDVLVRVNPDRSVSVLRLDLDDQVYLITGLAAEIFGMIGSGRSFARIRQNMIKKHDPPLGKFDPAFEKFIAWLLSEQMITT